jgi:hypothetical protein
VVGKAHDAVGVGYIHPLRIRANPQLSKNESIITNANAPTSAYRKRVGLIAVDSRAIPLRDLRTFGHHSWSR